MARRYGGVPILLEVSNDADLPRSSEEDTWNQVLADFDCAAGLLAKTSYSRGQVNKYAALAFKAEAMLYAGSIAKYNEDFSDRLSYLGEKLQEYVSWGLTRQMQRHCQLNISQKHTKRHAKL